MNMSHTVTFVMLAAEKKKTQPIFSQRSLGQTTRSLFELLGPFQILPIRPALWFVSTHFLSSTDVLYTLLVLNDCEKCLLGP